MPLIFGKADKRDYMLPKHRTRPNGYAALPGTGPAGEFCKTCKHLYRKGLGRVYLKCELMRLAWTGGKATDILANSPACKRWEKPEDEINP